MNLRSRFTLFSLLVAVIAGILFFATLTLWELNFRERLIVAQAEANIGSTSVWPTTLHFRQTDTAERELTSLARRLPAVAAATAYRVDGQSVAALPDAPVLTKRAERKRGDAQATISQTLTGVKGFGGDTPAWLDALLNTDDTLVISVPVSSVVNPLDDGVSPADYQRRLASTGDGSRYVVGYVEVAVPRISLVREITPTATRLVGVIAVLILIVFLAVKWFAGTISRPLARLARVAQEISAGELPKPLRIGASSPSEVTEIADVLNKVIEETRKIRAQASVDRSLMSLKVESTTRKLSAAVNTVEETRNKLQRVVNYDPVTGLPNRRLLVEQLELLTAIAIREHRHMALLLIDLDNLRRINETLGREAGDALIRQIAERLESTVRKSDIVSRSTSRQDLSRVDNDEFALVLHGLAAPEDSSLVAHRLMDALREPYTLDDQPVALRFNMGIALAPEHGNNAEAVLRAADIALNAASRHGGSVAVMYDPELDEAGAERFEIETALRSADMDREFALHYQPQINTAKGELVGAEALLRWKHPERGDIPPFKFIGIAEETGLIVDIGRWVIRRALADLQAMREFGVELPKVSVNVSTIQLNDGFVGEVAAAIGASGIDPACLELELTESLLVQDVDQAFERLDQLRNTVGVRLSVDDFGTGYSSLAYLARFPLNELKVDRSFVINLEQDANAAKIAGAIIAMGRELDLDIVVEGVDSTIQYRLLRDLGAHVIQGFLFSKPLPVGEFEAFAMKKPYLSQIEALERGD